MKAPESPRPRPVVAIDGPAGAGKSTLARLLATALGYTLVDTGAMYRAVALAARMDGVAWADGMAVGALARALADDGHLRLVPQPRGGVQVLLRGDDVSESIRTPEISAGASVISAHPPVREGLLALQRRAGEGGGVVLEGRDIGTVVFPDAEVKFFITARDDVRARRRHEELSARGTPASYEETLREVRQRDARDTGRPVAPLRQAEDAMLLDTSELTLDEALLRMVAVVRGIDPRLGGS